MRRRSAIGAVAGALLAGSVEKRARAAGAAPRVGFLAFNTREIARPTALAFEEGLAQRGWRVGRNITVDYRYADGHVDRLARLAAELVRLKVDVILAASSASTRAAKDVTRTIPIVMAASANAVGEGFIGSLSHPGGNVTGMTYLVPEVAGKQLELVKEIAPATSRIAVLANPLNLSHAAYLDVIASAAPRLAVQVELVEARSPDQLVRVFDAITGARAAALLVLTDSMFLGQRRQLVELAASSRVPAIYSQREFVDDGGLIAYGPSLADMFRRAATHVDKVLRGAVAGEIAVEQPTKFELVIGLKAASRLGLAIPRSLLLRADAVVD
jgi:putative ABC transport system substrate-binding protein